MLLRLVFALVLFFYSLTVQPVIAQENVPKLTIGKTVDQPHPLEGEPVLFEVNVSNTGGAPASDVSVRERLPVGLAIPEGLAVFTDQGFYQAADGVWVIGDISPGEGVIMTIPAVVIAEPQPPCIINTASIRSPAPFPFTPVISAAAAIRATGVQRCADLVVKRIFAPTPGIPCGQPWLLRYTFTIANQGPEEARDNVFTVTETDFKAPGFSLVSPGCSGLKCSWDSLPANTTLEIRGETRSFTNNIWQQHEVTAVINTADTDYVSGNNSQSWFIDLPPTSECGGLPDYEGAIEAAADAAGDAASPCFIATAAYGTPFDERIDTLRAFRDNTLERFQAGRWFIKQYYRHGPAAAAYIDGRPIMQSTVRLLLVPLLALIGYPIASFLCLTLALLTVLALRRRRQG